MAEELNDQERRETELWQVLDWSLWGNGLGDVLRESIADKTFAAITVEERETAERCIKAWHERRGPSMAVGEGTELAKRVAYLEARVGELNNTIGELRASIADIDAHATPVGLLHNDDPEGSPHHYLLTVGALHRALGKAYTAEPCESERARLRVEVDRLRREVEFEANGTAFASARRPAEADDFADIVADHRSCYMGMQGRLSLADLIAHLSVVAPGKSLDEIGINFATVKWVDDATNEEKRDRAERQRLADERHAQWERGFYERLKVKYGSVSVLPEETP